MRKPLWTVEAGWAVALVVSAGLSLASWACHAVMHSPALPEGFVRLSEFAPEIRQEMRYVGERNFLGRPVKGYEAAECILSRPAAAALKKVQARVAQDGLMLKVYDCYRPQRAVDDFVAWVADEKDTLMQPWFYPNVQKSRLFAEGYIAEKSGHSRGSTVDLTLIPLTTKTPLAADIDGEANLIELQGTDCRQPEQFPFRDESIPMGTAFDCFDPASHTENRAVSAQAQQNRRYLKRVMERYGFKNLPEEWWHYTLIDEPFPDRYFDFPVK